MLKITRAANGGVVFKVSGQLNVENLAELEKLIKAERTGAQIVLDLTDLISVDGEAVEFLANCKTDGIKLKNCSGYMGERIRREGQQ
jgi:anti-anti-sigma regulatory factor